MFRWRLKVWIGQLEGRSSETFVFLFALLCSMVGFWFFFSWLWRVWLERQVGQGWVLSRSSATLRCTAAIGIWMTYVVEQTKVWWQDFSTPWELPDCSLICARPRLVQSMLLVASLLLSSCFIWNLYWKGTSSLTSWFILGWQVPNLACIRITQLLKYTPPRVLLMMY